MHLSEFNKILTKCGLESLPTNTTDLNPAIWVLVVERLAERIEALEALANFSKEKELELRTEPNNELQVKRANECEDSNSGRSPRRVGDSSGPTVYGGVGAGAESDALGGWD